MLDIFSHFLNMDSSKSSVVLASSRVGTIPELIALIISNLGQDTEESIIQQHEKGRVSVTYIDALPCMLVNKTWFEISSRFIWKVCGFS
jgi:hypothetical protein